MFWSTSEIVGAVFYPGSLGSDASTEGKSLLALASFGMVPFSVLLSLLSPLRVYRV